MPASFLKFFPPLASFLLPRGQQHPLGRDTRPGRGTLTRTGVGRPRVKSDRGTDAVRDAEEKFSDSLTAVRCCPAPDQLLHN